MNRKMFILSGCNGAGKTTAAAILLPSLFERTEFVNADNIASEISPGPSGYAFDEISRRQDPGFRLERLTHVTQVNYF